MTGRTAQSLAAEARFLDWAADNRYELAQPFEWRGSRARYAATCGKGHACQPMPNRVDAGERGCIECGRLAAAAKRGAAAHARFLDWAADNGYELAQPFEWRGVMQAYPATCPQGHDCKPCPNAIQRGQGGCWGCRKLPQNERKTEAARARFLDWAADNGYELAQPFEWLGVQGTHAATCPEGHSCTPRPNDVSRGRGGCAECAGKVWDVFYVAVDDVAQTMKFGISSGSGLRRLAVHARYGFDRVELLLTGLPDTAALDTERRVKVLLAQRGARPVRGAEYFPLRWLPTVLEVAGRLNS